MNHGFLDLNKVPNPLRHDCCHEACGHGSVSWGFKASIQLLRRGVKVMLKQKSSIYLLTILLAAFSTSGAAAPHSDDDSDMRMVNVEVLEVSDTRISVIAQSGVEHVLAVDSANTKVKIDGKIVSLKDVRRGYIVTIELDELNPLKLAKNIDVASKSGSEVARINR
ncbi:MAG: hypothetical protein M3R15_21825 [Acidobacteriota bacterium]|nr:hypothetical protein [Acidobacteriota bacterium]